MRTAAMSAEETFSASAILSRKSFGCIPGRTLIDVEFEKVKIIMCDSISQICQVVSNFLIRVTFEYDYANMFQKIVLHSRRKSALRPQDVRYALNCGQHGFPTPLRTIF